MVIHHLGAVSADSAIKIADEVWIVTALLHRENSERADFSIEEIVERAKQEQIEAPLRAGFYVHVVQHCVANRPPNPGRCRILYETAAGRRRLFRRGDAYDPAREGSKTTPSPGVIPQKYQDLLSWFAHWSAKAAQSAREQDPLLDLYGSGKRLWADEPSDDYVNRLREGWPGGSQQP